jgi:hypothetical protein
MTKRPKANVLEDRHDTKPYWKAGTKRQPRPKVVINSHGGESAGHPRGSLTRGRLDKRARGGKITPKHDVELNVVNVRRPRRQLGGGLPAQAAPRATAALVARPALPAAAQGVRPFMRGGRW